MLTLLSQPTTYLQSAGNDSTFTVSGSNYLAPNVTGYQMIAQVFVNGALATTQKEPSDPVYPGYGVFNLDKIIPCFLSYDFAFQNNTGSIFSTASNSSCQVQLVFGEQYSLGTTFSRSLGLATSSIFAYVNSSLPYTDQCTVNMNNYLVTAVTSSQISFLSNFSSSISTYSSLRNFLYFFMSSSVSAPFVPVLTIRTFDGSNNVLGQYFVASMINSGNGMQYVATGYPQLSQLTEGTGSNQYVTTFGNTQMMNSQVSSYTVQLQGASNAPHSKVITYKIADSSDRWAPYSYNCYFLNELGGFESYKFQKKNQTSFTKEVSTYKRLPGQLQQSGRVQFNTYDRQESNYFTAITTNLELNSDWISDAESLTLIRSLFGSPVIYLEDNNGTLFSANITEKDYKINVKDIEKLFQVTFNFKLGQTDYRQIL